MRYRFGKFELDPAHRLLVKDGEPVALAAKAFDLLCELVANGGEVVAKDHLLESIWPDQYVEENNLSVQISALRKVLGGDGQVIATISGRGYSFVAPVEKIDDDGGDIVIEQRTFERITVEEISPQPIASLGSNRPNRFRLAVAGSIFFVAVVCTGYFWNRGLSAAAPAPFSQISVRRLTTNGKVGIAAYSPDGKLFAYSTAKALFLGHTAGGEPIELRPPADLAYLALQFSSDGNMLYYVVTGGEFPTGALFRLPVFGGAAEKLRENIKTHVSFSPDMTQFAYVDSRRGKDTSTLYISDTTGSSTREIVSRPMKNRFDSDSTAWSADGKMIAVSAISEISGGKDYEVFVVSPVDGQMRQLTSRNFRTIQGLAWFRDGSGLVMIASERLQTDRQRWYVSYPAGEVTAISPDLCMYGPRLGLSANGGSLLTVQEEVAANIWIAPAENFGDARQITFHSLGSPVGRHGMDWMPDGRIVYVAGRDKGMSLWTMNADGGNQKPLTPSGFIDWAPSVTADSRTVVFGSNRSGTFEVWRVGSDGDDLRQLTFDGDNEMPSVSPDGKWVFYISSRDGRRNVWRMPLAGGESVKLSDRQASWPRVSPDSRFIACGYETDGKPKLAVLSIDGGEPVKLFDLPTTANLRYALRWTPDGRTLMYRDWESGYWRQSLTGGEPERIENLPEEKLFSSSWSGDGLQFAFVRGQEIRDVILVQSIGK